MSILLGLEPFQKLAVGGWWVVGGGGQKTFESSALVQTLDLRLEAWTKLNNKLSLMAFSYANMPFLYLYILKEIWSVLMQIGLP